MDVFTNNYDTFQIFFAGPILMFIHLAGLNVTLFLLDSGKITYIIVWELLHPGNNLVLHYLSLDEGQRQLGLQYIFIGSNHLPWKVEFLLKQLIKTHLILVYFTLFLPKILVLIENMHDFLDVFFFQYNYFLLHS